MDRWTKLIEGRSGADRKPYKPAADTGAITRALMQRPLKEKNDLPHERLDLIKLALDNKNTYVENER